MRADEAGALFALAAGMARQAALRCGLLHLQDELTSVALEAVAKAIAAHDPQIGELRPFAATWIANELSNAVRDEVKRAARERPLHDEDGTDSVHPRLHAETQSREIVSAFVAVCIGEEIRASGEAKLLTREAWAALHEEIARLDDDDRRLVDLRYWEGMTWEAVGGALGVADRTARERDAKIRDTLRDRLIARERVRPIRRRP